jgi:hypothetical protein
MATSDELMTGINELIENNKSLSAKLDRLLDTPVAKPQTVTELSYNGKEVIVKELDVTALSVGLNLQNEKAFKLKGHPFTKFGIAVYNDGTRFTDMGIDENLDFGEHDYSQRVVVEFSEPDAEGRSKPLKVLRIAQ